MRKESGAWLNSLLSTPLGTFLFLDNDTVRIAASLRVGTKICHPHKCRCGAAWMNSGLTAWAARRMQADWQGIPQSTTSSAFASVHVPAVLEPTGTYRNDRKRPDGVTLMPCGGKASAFCGMLHALIPWQRATSHQHPVLPEPPPWVLRRGSTRSTKVWLTSTTLFPSLWRPLALSEKEHWT